MQSGIIIIAFNQLIKVPDLTYDTIKEQEFISLNIAGPLTPYDYSWEIYGITQSQIEFHIKFEKPNLIGMFSVILYFLIS